jgi:hypothetical protein
MRALLVYESMFGNTRAIALAIAEGIRSLIDVDTVEVGDAPAAVAADVDLLVVGGPTHARGLTSARTRESGAARAGARLVSRGPGIREWLDAVLPERTGILATAFDTRIKGPEIFTGSAAKGAARRLKALRFRVVAPTSFFVGGSADEPFERISDAELERARAWGRTLGEAVAAGQLVASR